MVFCGSVASVLCYNHNYSITVMVCATFSQKCKPLIWIKLNLSVQFWIVPFSTKILNLITDVMCL